MVLEEPPFPERDAVAGSVSGKMQDYHLGETGEPVRMAPLQAEVKWKHWPYPVWEDASSRVEPRIIFVPDCAFCMVRAFLFPVILSNAKDLMTHPVPVEK